MNIEVKSKCQQQRAERKNNIWQDRKHQQQQMGSTFSLLNSIKQSGKLENKHPESAHLCQGISVSLHNPFSFIYISTVIRHSIYGSLATRINP